MKKRRIYLDNCCYNRPYDDQSQIKVQLETTDKLLIQKLILEDSFELVWSYILDYENSANPYEEQKNIIARWRNVAKINVKFSDMIVKIANDIVENGIDYKDALHIACAVGSQCNFFITVDKDLLSFNSNEIVMINPIEFVKILGGNYEN